MKFSFGPGAIVTAAFIGPGTVTTCILAGASQGYALVWALVFATFSAIVLQDMSARLGVLANRGLAEAVSELIPNSLLKISALCLIFLAVAIGNAAYESGNIAGGTLGLETILGSNQRTIIIFAIGLLAGSILYSGKYKVIEPILLALVAGMVLAFLFAAIVIRPDLLALLKGLMPSMPQGSLLTIFALIGTTVVPYNLFLHASASKERWTGEESEKPARLESLISITIGGVISVLILTIAASSLGGRGIEIANARDMALALEPAYGSTARYLIGIGLFGAGLTSAITAPMAAAYVFCETVPAQEPDQQKLRFRISAFAVLGIGLIVALLGIKPVQLILVAQAANGLLLPIAAIFLLLVMNKSTIMGTHTNSRWINSAGGLVILVTLFLGTRLILKVLGFEI